MSLSNNDFDWTSQQLNNVNTSIIQQMAEPRLVKCQYSTIELTVRLFWYLHSIYSF